MEEACVIKKITEPSDWCAPMVPVLKPLGRVRICTDYKKLNVAVKRERYMLPTMEDLLFKLQGSAVFSRLDATSGFHQLPLDEASQKLTTFITPFGRYIYKRLPFGISSAPEIFQRTMENILKDHTNVICFFDDILVYSATAKDHEKHLSDVMSKLEKKHVKLNPEKCELRRSEIEFLGKRITKDGVSPDPKKVQRRVAYPCLKARKARGLRNTETRAMQRKQG